MGGLAGRPASRTLPIFWDAPYVGNQAGVHDNLTIGGIDKRVNRAYTGQYPAAVCPIHPNQHSRGTVSQGGAAQVLSVAWRCPYRGPVEKSMICLKCNGFFRVRSPRYEPAPQVDKLVRCPYCGRRNEVVWPMGAAMEIVAEARPVPAAAREWIE